MTPNLRHAKGLPAINLIHGVSVTFALYLCRFMGHFETLVKYWISIGKASVKHCLYIHGASVKYWLSIGKALNILMEYWRSIG
jgi:hypothetical protein